MTFEIGILLRVQSDHWCCPEHSSAGARSWYKSAGTACACAAGFSIPSEVSAVSGNSGSEEVDSSGAALAEASVSEVGFSIPSEVSAVSGDSGSEEVDSSGAALAEIRVYDGTVVRLIFASSALFWLLEVQPLAITAAQRLTKTRKIIPYSDLLITKAAPCVYLSW